MKSERFNNGAFLIAKSEAEELLNQAMIADKEIKKILNNGSSAIPFGKIITANILLGLSIEIYLKAFMIGGRDEGVIKGHLLKDLYYEFPSFLKSAIESRYNSYDKSGIEIGEFALVISKDKPEKPEESPFLGRTNDFENILEAISNTFVYSRYFFENISNKDWAVIKYYFGYGELIALSLKKVLADYEAGRFKEKRCNA